MAGAVVARADPAWEFDLAAEVEGNYDDNSGLVPDGAQESQILVAVRPSASVRGDVRRWVDVGARYQLTYFAYQKAGLVPAAPELLHNGQLRLALTRWEDVDVEVEDRLQAVGLEYGLPHDEPQNLAQRNRAGATVSLGYATPFALRLNGGYALRRVDYFKPVAPAYLVHGPRLGAGLEVARNLDLGLEYRLTIQNFDDAGTTKPSQAPRGDLTQHGAFVRGSFQGGVWTRVDLRAGYQYVDLELGTAIRTFGSALDLLLDPTEKIGLAVGAEYGLTADLAGNPGVKQEVHLAGAFKAMEPLWLRARAAAGALELETGGAAPSKERRDYLRGEASVEYSLGWISTRAGFVHHRFDGPAGVVAVNRAFVGVIGHYSNVRH